MSSHGEDARMSVDRTSCVTSKRGCFAFIPKYRTRGDLVGTGHREFAFAYHSVSLYSPRCNPLSTPPRFSLSLSYPSLRRPPRPSLYEASPSLVASLSFLPDPCYFGKKRRKREEEEEERKKKRRRRKRKRRRRNRIRTSCMHDAQI